METVKLKTETREQSGKGNARRLRASGLVPAVFYGRGVATRALAVSPKDLKAAVSGEFGLNRVLELQIGNESLKALLTDYQYHPVSRELLHADFVGVEEGREVNVEVPLEFVGKAKGIIMGGNVRQVFLKLPVRCLPANIPAKLTHDVSGLDVEDTVMVSELTLPEGVTVRLRPSQTVGGCFGNRRKAGDDGDEETAAAAGGDAAAKPGAAAAKPAAAAPKAKGK